MVQPTSSRCPRRALVAVAAAALLLLGAATSVRADSSGASSRSGGSSSSGSSSRSGVSNRGSGSSSSSVSNRSGGSVQPRGSTSGSTRSQRGAVVTRPSHGRVPPRWSGGHSSHWHHSWHYGLGFGFYGYYPGWGYPYYYSPYSHYPPVVYASAPGYGMGALDLNVDPKQTEIFVNGQYVGLAKQYDGFPGYLWLESGLYEIAFYRPGYETVTRQFEIFTGMVLDVALDMTPGEASLPGRPEAAAQVRTPESGLPRQAPGGYASTAPSAPREDASGRLELSVEPTGASVYLDGRFVGTGDELAGGLAVAAGQHVVEVVLPGYEQETVRFDVDPGLDAAVEVRLEPLGPAGGGS